jgi:hypothetical protein
MGKASSFGALGLLLVSCGAAARAELYAPQPSVDAGEVRCGAALSHRFSFINRGPEPVKLLDVHASCGCLKPQLSSRTLQPGEAASLLLEVNTLSQASGHHTWPVRIAYRDRSGEQEMTLQLTGQIVTEISMQPARLTVLTDSGVEHTITLTDLRPHPLTVSAVCASAPYLHMLAEQRSEDEKGHRVWKIRVAVDATCPQGHHEELIRVSTDDPAYAELHVPVTIDKQARQRLTAAPNPVTFSMVSGESIASRIVLVRDRADEQVVIDRVVSDDPALQCRWAQGPGGAVTVKVTLDQSRMTGTRWESAIHIHLLKPTADVLTVPVESTPP